MRRRLILFFVCFVVSFAMAMAAPPRQGQGRSQGSHQRQGQTAQRDRTQQQSTTRQQERARLHDCQQACVKASSEARQLQRYADRERFETQTARQLGQQLRQHLEVMDREHARLQEQMTPQEREQHRQRLETMAQSQQRWQSALDTIESELGGDTPNREELRRQARTIEKEIKNYRKELNRLESALS